MSRDFIRPRNLFTAAFGIAFIATLGSLSYSNLLGFYPCKLCWYQRILMYPLVPLLGYAAYTNTTGLARLVPVYTIPGIAIAAFHSYLQLVPGATCGVDGCSTVYFRVLWLSIPNQSLLAFLLITGLAATIIRESD